MAKFINLYVRKVPQFEKLTFRQQTMVRIGQFALDQWKTRTISAVNPNDTPAKPLTKRWAIIKAHMMSGNSSISAPSRWKYESASKRHGMKFQGEFKNPANWHIKSAKRDYTVTGALMAGLTLRQVSDNVARARWTSENLRKRASGLSELEQFVAFSPRNIRATVDFTRPIFKDMTKRLLVEKTLNAK